MLVNYDYLLDCDFNFLFGGSVPMPENGHNAPQLLVWALVFVIIIDHNIISYIRDASDPGELHRIIL